MDTRVRRTPSPAPVHVEPSYWRSTIWRFRIPSIFVKGTPCIRKALFAAQKFFHLETFFRFFDFFASQKGGREAAIAMIKLSTVLISIAFHDRGRLAKRR
jgi:hypothetical protein